MATLRRLGGELAHAAATPFSLLSTADKERTAEDGGGRFAARRLGGLGWQIPLVTPLGSLYAAPCLARVNTHMRHRGGPVSRR